MTPDVNVCVIDFKNIPGREMVTVNEDGSYTILINSRLNYESQMEAFNHAMRHINSDDFQKTDVQLIEAIAHKTTIPPKKEELSDFHKRLLAKIKKKRKKIQRELREIEECNAWMESYDPIFFEKMKPYFIEMQKLGNL